MKDHKDYASSRTISPAGTQVFQTGDPLPLKHLRTPLSLSPAVFGELSFLCITLLLPVTTARVWCGKAKGS